MANNTTQEAAKYEVCFVQTGASSEEATEILKLAFEAMDSNQLEPTWITVADCLKISKKEPKLFILDPFEGEAFEHIKTIQCRIVGPLCILYCLQYSDVLPKRSYPVYSVSMRKITVSCSNIPAKVREEISTRVQLMGGFFSKDLTKSVTHLVVGEVGSQKYKVAANFGLPIMVPGWITDVWENGQYKQLHASDGCYDKYKCPVFKGLVITVSQLSAEERLAIKSVIEDNGGSYLGALKANETTHLVLNEPSGDKYRFAKNWKVFCVNVNWIHDSVETGYCRDEALYGIDESAQTLPKRSTPKKDLTACELPLVDCSAIAGNSGVSHLDETMRSDVSISVSNRKHVYHLLDEFNLSNLPKYSQFLDGCKIYLTGFNSLQMDKLRKIVNSGGGMRFSKYSDSISHVVCGDLSEDFMHSLKSSSVKPYVVNFKWLLECCKNEKLVDEKPYLCMDATPLSPEKCEAPELKKEISLHLSQNSQPRKDDFVQDNITDIFKQYINDQQHDDDKENYLNSKSVSNCSKNRLNNLAVKPVQDLPDINIPVIDLDTQPNCADQNASTKKDEENNIEVIENEDISSSENLFSGLKFIIIGFGEKDSEILSCMVEAHAGVISKEANSSCDIAVVPVIWYDLNIPVSNVVTNCWLQKCIEDSRIYDFDENELFRPFSIVTDEKPFESFVISFSQYVGTERDCLIHLSESLGAVCQEYFVRKANAAKRVLANTHLVVSIPDGSKYEASKKWKIPSVTKQWVIDTARLGIVPPVDKYLVEKFPEFPPCSEEIVSAKDVSVITENKNKNNSLSRKEPSKLSEDNMAQRDQEIESCDKNGNENLSISTPQRPRLDSSNISEPVKIDTNGFEAPNPTEISGVAPQHKRIAELCNESGTKLSPVRSQTDNSLDASLNLDQTRNFQFHVSGILNDLDASVSRESCGGSKRHSLPVEEMFSRNLASALRRMEDKSLSEKASNLIDEKKTYNENCSVLSGVVIYVSRKLSNIQIQLNEIVILLGGDYIWTYDNSCTHFIFVGKTNDITKEFREAKSQGKKIVSPEWLYACRDKGIHVEEELYPHTFKSNLSLSQQISILKVPRIEEPKEEIQEIKKMHTESEEPVKEEVDFNKQLNELLVAAKSAKKRNSKRVVNSLSSSPIPEISPVQKLQRHLSDVYIKHTKVDDRASEEPDTCSQHSQSYPIMWDDPTGRLEREKIAARAAENAEKLKQDLIQKLNDEKKVSNEIPEIDIEAAAKAKDSAMAKVKKFMFTNISDSAKSEYIEIIKKLGGEISDEKTFDITATHLILSVPIKNEKFLSSVASGKWVLHPQYLTASSEQNKFLAEVEFEWGGPATDNFTENLPSSSIKIAKCPHRWRSKLQEGVITSGAFDSWIVVIHADDKAKLATYTKILESGGAEIIPSDSVDSAMDRITHVFVDLKKRNANKTDLNCYLSHNMNCLKPEYLAFFLIEDPPPKVENFLISEAKEKLIGADTSSKKRNSSTASRQSKRARLK